MRKRTQIRILALVSTIFYLFSWLALPIHLYGIESSHELDLCQLLSRETSHHSFGSFGSRYEKLRGGSGMDGLSKHDERYCSICSLAHNKAFYDTAKSDFVIVMREWDTSFQILFVPTFFTSITSIRAPPIANLYS